MKKLIATFVLLAGCSHYHSPRSGDVAEVGFTTRISRSDLAHQTKISVGSSNHGFKQVDAEDEIKVRPGIQSFKFEGQWYDTLARNRPPHQHYAGCGCDHWHGHGSSGASDLIGGIITASVLIGAEAAAHAKQVQSECTAQITLEVQEGDDVELTFRHDHYGRCDVECVSYGRGGRQDCAVVALR